MIKKKKKNLKSLSVGYKHLPKNMGLETKAKKQTL